MFNKVLIVEDSALQAKMYRMVFSKYQSCALSFATNGIEALNQLSLQNDIDLIILDINMPKMNGLLFLEAMRRDGFDHIPVIVISTEGKDEDIRRALELGASAYIKKPWDAVHLRGLIGKLEESIIQMGGRK